MDVKPGFMARKREGYNVVDMSDFISDQNTYAVVGATVNQEKFGYKVLKKLKDNGLRVVGVNPKYEEVLGVKCYPSLAKIDISIDTVVTVVKPEATEEVVKECVRLGIKKIWMQPGSESEKAIEIAEQAGIGVVSGACIVVDGLKQNW